VRPDHQHISSGAASGFALSHTSPIPVGRAAPVRSVRQHDPFGAALFEKGGDARLEQLLALGLPVRNQFRSELMLLRQAQDWMINIAHILDVPLPEFDSQGQPPRAGQAARVQRKLNRYLMTLRRLPDLPKWLNAFRKHLIDITARWGADLFVCYDIVGLPNTNNALESRFGRLRREQRRISGRQFNTATLLDEGPYLLWECGNSEAEVLARLQKVAANRADYQRRYQRLRDEQMRRQLAYRLQHQSQKVFRKLEVQWAELHRKP
jgi:hypothetical protein